MFSLLKKQHFILGLLSVLCLAWMLPEAGSNGGWLRGEWSSKLAVFIIFLNQGLSLQSTSIHEELRRWPIHITFQSYIFIFCPLLYGAISLSVPEVSADLKIGIFYVAALPTTVSTCLVYTQRAGGNVVLTLNNIIFANTLSVLITPLWMQAWMSQSIPTPPLFPLLLKLILLILLPLSIGLLLQKIPRIKHGAKQLPFSTVNSSLILFIIYCAFSNAFVKNAWSQVPPIDILKIAAVMLTILAINMPLNWLLSSALRFKAKDKVSFFFCGTFKSLASGVPMAGLIFEKQADSLAVILIPLFIYAIAQLTTGSWIAERLSSKDPQFRHHTS